TRWFAGNTQAAVVLGHRLTIDAPATRTQDVPVSGRPLGQLGHAIKQILRPGQRAFGYLTFELAHLATGSTVVRSVQPLAHFLVPQVEICWNDAGTHITSNSPSLLDAVVDIVRAAAPCPPPPTMPVDLDP